VLAKEPNIEPKTIEPKTKAAKAPASNESQSVPKS
jgi:hypothetical protein